MELLQLFDENKKMVDEYVVRKPKCDIPPKRNIMYILLFIQNDEGKYLVQKTSKEKGSVFAVTGGGVDYGDDDYKTVFKEAKEELGLDLDKNKLYHIDTIKGNKDINVLCSIYYYKDNIDLNNLVLQKEEVEDVFLFTDEEIDELNNIGEFRKGNILPYEIVKKWLKEYNNE